jgi:hypothetical protein
MNCSGLTHARTRSLCKCSETESTNETPYLIGLGPGELQHVVVVALEDARRLLGRCQHLVRDDEVFRERVPAPALPLIDRLLLAL